MNIIDDFKNYAGYYLNCIVMVGCIVISLYQIKITKDEHDKEMLILKSSIEESLTDRVNNNVTIDKAYTDIAFWIRAKILKNPFEAKQVIRNNTGSRLDAYRERADHNRYIYVYINTDIYKVIRETNFSNKDEQVNYLCAETDSYITKETPFLINKPIIVIWNVITFIYLIIVWILYKGKGISMKENESLLNIVDVGFYLALIQFTGGFHTLILFKIAISFAIFVAILDFNRIRKNVKERFDGGIYQAIKTSGLLVVLRSFSQVFIYIIVLISGLIWATITQVNYENSYWTMLSKLLIVITAIALSFHFLVFLITNTIIKKNSK